MLLHNRSVRVPVRNREINLVGVGDLWSNELYGAAAFRSLAESRRTILLCHNPDGKDSVERFPWDLMLSGHTHGGQVRLPHDPVRYAPVQDRRFVQGLGQWNERQIYVSRGVGSLGSVRFLCRPEITVLDLQV
jgi:predicted MPP superfamily phosphohydrolase